MQGNRVVHCALKFTRRYYFQRSKRSSDKIHSTDFRYYGLAGLTGCNRIAILIE